LKHSASTKYATACPDWTSEEKIKENQFFSEKITPFHARAMYWYLGISDASVGLRA
jgi:hypothetical protein